MSLVDRIKRKLVQRIMCEVSAADVRDSLLALNESQRQTLLEAVRRQQTDRVGLIINRAVVTHIVEPQAQQEAEAAVADGQITTAEAERILFDEC